MLRERLQTRLRELLKHKAVTSAISPAEIAGIEDALPHLTIIELLVLISAILAMIVEWFKNN